MKEDFLKEITNKNNNNGAKSSDYLDKKLQFIIGQNIKPEKFIGDLDIDVKSQLGPILPLHFFNEFFPKVSENEESADSSDEESLSEENDVQINKPKRMSKKSSTNVVKGSTGGLLPSPQKKNGLVLGTNLIIMANTTAKSSREPNDVHMKNAETSKKKELQRLKSKLHKSSEVLLVIILLPIISKASSVFSTVSL